RGPTRHKARRFLLREGAVGGDRSGENRKARVAVELLGKRQERARVLREARAAPWEETPRPILGIPETFGTPGRCGKGPARIDVEQREYLLELVEEADLRSVEEVCHVLRCLRSANGHRHSRDVAPRCVQRT